MTTDADRVMAALRESWPELEAVLQDTQTPPADADTEWDRTQAQRALAVMAQRRCHACQTACTGPVLKCLACGCAGYCSPACRGAHATPHRALCAAMAEFKAHMKAMVYRGHVIVPNKPKT